MNMIRSTGALALALLLAACGERQSVGPEGGYATDSSTANVTAEAYSSTGTVQSVAADRVTIAHGPIEGIGWPAMTMTFVAEPSQLSGLKEGSQVAFAFRQDGGRSVITSISGQKP